MIHLRKYATLQAFNGDATRIYPTVSYITEGSGDVRYDERPPVLRLVSGGTNAVVAVSYDPEVISEWPNIWIDNTIMPTYNFTYDSNNDSYVYNSSTSTYRYTYRLSKDGTRIRSTYTRTSIDDPFTPGMNFQKTYNSDGSIYDGGTASK